MLQLRFNLKPETTLFHFVHVTHGPVACNLSYPSSCEIGAVEQYLSLVEESLVRRMWSLPGTMCSARDQHANTQFFSTSSVWEPSCCHVCVLACMTKSGSHESR